MSQSSNYATYTDGDEIEDALLEVFRSPDREQKVAELRDANWSFKYHLDRARQNILNWYNFDPRSTALEIGAGCGAITELLVEKVAKVVAVELSDRRAEIIKARLSDASNLEVWSENLENYRSDEKFDLVTSIGVLEYSGRFIDSHTPYLDFIKMTSKFLKPDGALVLAIENRLGLKYWGGAPEDHTGGFFDGIENYPIDSGVRTFSRKELAELLTEAGFNDLEFFYPIPDYKFVSELFSDNYLPTPEHNIAPWTLQTYDGGRTGGRERLFNERRVNETLIRHNLFPMFANSFLVFAKQ